MLKNAAMLGKKQIHRLIFLVPGEILTVVTRDEEQWWTAKNSLGQMGLVPVPYVQKYEEDGQPNMDHGSRQESSIGGNLGSGSNTNSSQIALDTPPAATTRRSNIQRTLPAFAKVKQARVPNAYDKTALKLEVGDIIKVTKTNINGQWEGELHGKVGHFPFTHVEFVDNETGEENQEMWEISWELLLERNNRNIHKGQRAREPGWRNIEAWVGETQQSKFSCSFCALRLNFAIFTLKN